MNYCPSNLLSLWFTSPTLQPLSKVQSTVYADSVCIAGRGWGVLSCVGDHMLHEFNILYLIRFRTYNIALPTPKQKPRRGGSLRQINTCRKVPLKVNFLDTENWHCFLSV